MVDEVHHSISQVDPKKTVQVGSFRVDSRGNQATHEKPYARSEIHLIETLESICEKFRDYSETTDSAGHKTVIRTSSRNGLPLKLSNIKLSAEKQQLFKFKCEHLIEDYEEDMIGIFRKEGIPEEKVEQIICGDIVSVCTAEELNTPLPEAELNVPEDSVEDEGGAVEEEEEAGDNGEDSNQSEPDDPELLEEFIKDNIPADTIITGSKKEEL